MKSALSMCAAVAAGLFLSACAAEAPSFGERLQTQGMEMGRIGDDWSKGAEQVAEGGKLISRGEDRVRDGRSDIAKGESLTREGRSRMAEAEGRHRLGAVDGSLDGPVSGSASQGR